MPTPNPIPLAQMIAELRKLEGAATPGPWEVGSTQKSLQILGRRMGNGMRELIARMYLWAHVGRQQAQADSDFITAMRNNLPALLDLAELAVELRTELNLWRESDYEAIQDILGDTPALIARFDAIAQKEGK